MSSLRILAATAALLVAPLVAAQPAPAPSAGTAADAPTVQAVWVEKKISYVYMGFTAYYSCNGLYSKVKAILKEIGVRPDMKLTSRNCINLSGPERMPGVDIVAALPVAATPEVLAELAKDASKRELAARAGKKGAAASEATAQFPALARRVTFTDNPLGVVQAGDCELVDQMREQVFVPLGAKIIESRMGCVPKQLNNGIINLPIEVLQPVPQE
jgi:hypothetical protein